MGKVLLVVSFLTLTPAVLLASLIALISISSSSIKLSAKSSPPVKTESGVSIYASLPSGVPTISGHITVGDARPGILRQYLSYYDSPLTSYADEIVSLADQYGIDFRLVPAIAQQESNLCHVIPPGSYNCWGWGITSVSSLGFDSYEDGIKTVTSGLKNNYIDDGLLTPDQIMTKYTPSSNGSWARGVNEFMSEMQ